MAKGQRRGNKEFKKPKRKKEAPAKDERADSAVVAILTPICVEKFQQSVDVVANLAALTKISSTWEQGNFIEKGGWATRPGATSADYVLARACAEKLVQAKSAAQ